MYQAKYLSDSKFIYNTVEFSQDSFNLFAGLCAVDTKESVAAIMKELSVHGLSCARMGVYKPRTHPDSFQGHGKQCLPYVFELAGKYSIKVIAMEITKPEQIQEISQALEYSGHATGVMLQIGTRNTQNFELLKAVGAQNDFPVLFKRGFGITLAESLSASEYISAAGNKKIIFCLRGIKSVNQEPHRNLVDFAHIPVVKKLTNMPVCIDPSHSVGSLSSDHNGIKDIYHASAQGIIAGANMALTDFHYRPEKALVDSKQSLHINELGSYLEDIKLVRQAYLQRKINLTS